MEKELKECDNPDCDEKFIPYSNRQRTCKKMMCKIWLREQAYQKNKYKLSREKISEIISTYLKCMHGEQDVEQDSYYNVIITQDDLEKI